MTTTLPSVFQKYRIMLNSAMRAQLSTRGLAVYRMLEYSMGWADVEGQPVDAVSGKALRPTLCLLACEAAGGDPENALPAAVSLELIHHFSLIHDDIQDRDETRHHRRTLWAVWGEPKAIVAGNTLRVIADRSLWDLIERGVPYRSVVTAADLLTEAYLQMIEGQYLDLSFEGRPDITLDEYLTMISCKTGALIRCSMNLGAVIGSGAGEAVEAFRECGRSLGFVFQIRDDILGIWGDQKATGKPVGADIVRKKNSLPIVYSMSKAGGVDRAELQAIYRKASPDGRDVETVLDIMDTLGARAYAQGLASAHCTRALETLEAIDVPRESRAHIEEIARFLLVREH
ncbi:MAG: polyprenyl synthetase family protein [Chloroflexi bacterium]|nr:polyprenyl synthetase family protein [Chloroflexota bacterium]